MPTTLHESIDPHTSTNPQTDPNYADRLHPLQQSYHPYRRFDSTQGLPTPKRDWVRCNSVYGSRILCNSSQTFTKPTGGDGRFVPYSQLTGDVAGVINGPAGTSSYGNSFYAKNGVRSFRTEQGFRDIMGVPSLTEQFSSRSEGLYSGRGNISARSNDSSDNSSRNRMKQPVFPPYHGLPPESDVFEVPIQYRSSYRLEFPNNLKRTTNVARPAGKSETKIGY